MEGTRLTSGGGGGKGVVQGTRESLPPEDGVCSLLGATRSMHTKGQLGSDPSTAWSPHHVLPVSDCPKPLQTFCREKLRLRVIPHRRPPGKRPDLHLHSAHTFYDSLGFAFQMYILFHNRASNYLICDTYTCYKHSSMYIYWKTGLCVCNIVQGRIYRESYQCCLLTFELLGTEPVLLISRSTDPGTAAGTYWCSLNEAQVPNEQKAGMMRHWSCPSTSLRRGQWVDIPCRGRFLTKAMKSSTKPGHVNTVPQNIAKQFMHLVLSPNINSVKCLEFSGSLSIISNLFSIVF